MSSRFVFDRAPLRVYWEITRACALACRHCRAEATPRALPGELDHAEALGLLDRLAAFGDPLPHLVLTGGDPLEREDLFELIAAARARGLGVSVSPSGTPRLTREAIARLKGAGVEAISLSLDGSTAEKHDDVRQVPGCFDRTLAAARAATDTGLLFQVNTLVAEETLADIPAIGALVSSLRAPRWSLFFLVSVGRGTVLQPISASACEELMRWLADVKLDGTPVVTTTEAPHYRRVLTEKGRGPIRHGGGIRDGNGILFISYLGELCPSGFLPLVRGNTRTHDLVEVYRNDALFKQLRDPTRFGERCGRCEYHHLCGGSRARAYQGTEDPFADDPLCLYDPPPRKDTARRPDSQA